MNNLLLTTTALLAIMFSSTASAHRYEQEYQRVCRVVPIERVVYDEYHYDRRHYDYRNSHDHRGTVIGTVAGAAIGRNSDRTVEGAIIGAIVGHEIDKHRERRRERHDRRYHYQPRSRVVIEHRTVCDYEWVEVELPRHYHH